MTTREELVERYPTLEYLFTAYFIPYWQDDHDSVEAVVAEFVRDDDPELVAKAVREFNDIRSVCGENDRMYEELFDELVESATLLPQPYTEMFRRMQHVVEHPEEYSLPDRGTRRQLTKAATYPDLPTANAVSTDVARANAADLLSWENDRSRGRLALEHHFGRQTGVVVINRQVDVGTDDVAVMTTQSEEATCESAVVVFARPKEGDGIFVLTSFPSPVRPGPDGRLPSASYPWLFQLFGAYLNEDWTDHYAEPADAVLQFVQEMPEEHVAGALRELREIRARYGNTDEAMQVLLDLENGCPAGVAYAWDISEYLDMIERQLGQGTSAESR